MTNAKSYTLMDTVISSAEYSGDGFHFSFVGKAEYEAALKEIEALKSQNAMLHSLNDSALELADTANGNLHSVMQEYEELRSFLELADTANGQLHNALNEYKATVQLLESEISQLYSQIAALEKDADLGAYTGLEDWPSFASVTLEATEDAYGQDTKSLLHEVRQLQRYNDNLREVLARELEHLL